MSFYYPDNEDVLYYVEFQRGGNKNEFTLFKRHWFLSEGELEKIKEENPDDFSRFLRTNQCHPWNIFTATYGPLGAMPDEHWVRFMVDALNREVSHVPSKENYDAALATLAQHLVEDKKILDKLIAKSNKST